MNRRTNLTVLLSGALSATTASAEGAKAPIQLHVEMQVAPEREKEVLNNYRTIFLPAIRKQPKFVDAKLLKYRSTPAGKHATDANYRLVLVFETEEARLHWVKTDTHQKVWPTIEKNLKSANVTADLYDTVV